MVSVLDSTWSGLGSILSQVIALVKEWGGRTRGGGWK